MPNSLKRAHSGHHFAELMMLLPHDGHRLNGTPFVAVNTCLSVGILMWDLNLVLSFIWDILDLYSTQKPDFGIPGAPSRADGAEVLRGPHSGSMILSSWGA